MDLSLECYKRDVYIINLTKKLLDRANDSVGLEEIANSIQENLFYTYACERRKYNDLEERQLIFKLCKPSLLHTTQSSISVMESLVYVKHDRMVKLYVAFLCSEQK